ncbi:MAG: AAA family ATPase, partial [Pseudomonadota bacterium]
SDEPEAVEASTELVRLARNAELLVLLVCGEVSPRTMHSLLREGVAEFAPYPEPEGALSESINRMRLLRSSGGRGIPTSGGKVVRKGRVITVYGAAGGVGASTYAVNLSWELANLVRREGRRVLLMDFNFQYGSVATFLDVPRREAVYELVSEASTLDQTGLTQALSTYNDRLHVLTAPRDALPLDIVSPNDVAAIVNHARDMFDYVVIDMPQALMSWSEQVYNASDEFHAVMEIDMRSAQNMFRFIRTLKSEDMGLEKLVFLLNRAPGLTDLSGKARVKRVAESLGLDFSFLLPDGGRQVINACDQGVPLAEAAKTNPLRREVAKIAQKVLASEEVEAKASES